MPVETERTHAPALEGFRLSPQQERLWRLAGAEGFHAWCVVDVEGPLGAFTFPHAKGAKLFFPTVHVHDGEVHKTAEFDHELYLQPKNASQMLPSSRRGVRVTRP